MREELVEGERRGQAARQDGLRKRRVDRFGRSDHSVGRHRIHFGLAAGAIDKPSKKSRNSSSLQGHPRGTNYCKKGPIRLCPFEGPDAQAVAHRPLHNVIVISA